MTDDLRDLSSALLADPPHPPPSLDELQTRVDRRRQRRARAIGIASIVTIVLVAAAVLALPRDTELRVGGGDATTTTATPPMPPPAATDVQLTVSPESAPLVTDRTLEVRNTSDQPYDECGLRFELRRWGGTQFVPEAILYTATEPPFLTELDDGFNSSGCVHPVTIEPDASTAIAFNPGTTVRLQNGGTVPAGREPLEPGWYELASVSMSTSPLTAAGRFEITAGEVTDVSPTVIEPAPQTVTTQAGQPSETVGGISVESTVDLWPGADLEPAGEVLPTDVLVVDDHTVALAWRGPCNQPADHVDVRMTEDDVELRLHVGEYTGRSCTSVTDRWAVTFGLGGSIGQRTLTVRAGDQQVVTPAPPPPAVSSGMGSLLPEQLFSFRIERPAGDAYRLIPPDPLDSVPGLWCVSGVTAIGSTDVAGMVVAAPNVAGADEGCDDIHDVTPAEGRTLFGTR